MQQGAAQLFLSQAGVRHLERWRDEIKGGRRYQLGTRVNIEPLGRIQNITHLNRNEQRDVVQQHQYPSHFPPTFVCPCLFPREMDV